MENSLNLQPANVFYYFEQLAKIPHGSGDTKAISDYCVNFAKERGYEVHQDEYNDVIIIREAAKGYENAEPIIIQGHLDMVCEKEADCNIDFEKDGLDLYVDGEFLKAKGTTLGGDDGIAVAYGLALLAEEDLQAPRLEMIFTVDEETTMYGAQMIDLSPIKGHIVLNIDGEEEGEFLTSSAGGAELAITLPVKREEMSGTVLEVEVAGLYGGHSGAEIHKERANASKLMGRILKNLSDNMNVGLAHIEGGTKPNAITRASKAVIVVEDEKAATAIINDFAAILKNEYRTADAGLTVNVTKLEDTCKNVINETGLAKVLFLLREVPHGVMANSVEIDNLVETSINLGMSELHDDEYYMYVSIRSSVSSRKEELVDRVTFLGEFLGASVEKTDDYPAWEYNPNSEVVGKIAKVYEDLFGKKPEIKAIHAGLECGYLDAKIDGLDAVSFGPDIHDVHTPQEHMNIASAGRIWTLLLEFLKNWK